MMLWVALIVMATVGFSDLITISIPISNHSFEDPAVPTPGSLNLGTVGSGWTGYFPSSPSSARGQVDNLYSYPNTTSGEQYIFITARRSNADALAATLGTPSTVTQLVMGGTDQRVLAAGDELTLTVSLIDLLNTPSNFRFGLYSDAGLTEVLAERVSTTASPILLSNTVFQDYTLEWTAGALDAGKTVYIGFKAEDYSAASSAPRLGIDNVRLDLIPEPATIGMLGLGSLLAWGLRRRSVRL